MRAKARLLLVDDHVLLRQGIAKLLQEHPWCEVVGEASTGQEGLEMARALQPDVVLTEGELSDMTGLQLLRLLQEEHPQLKTMILTEAEDESAFLAAVRAGVRGYIDRRADADHLVQAVQQVIAGDVALSSRLASRLVAEYAALAAGQAGTRSREGHLTEREIEILRLIASGQTNKEIAKRLLVSENTVRAHLRSIMQKLQVQNRVQAAAYALRAGIVSRDRQFVENG